MRHAIPTHEIEIGRRLREWRRLEEGAHRTAIARAIQETPEKLAAYEAGRAPIRMDVFAKLWTQYRVNAQFLNEGRGPRMLRISAFPGVDDLVKSAPPRALFSAFYKETLASVFNSETGRIESTREWIGQQFDQILDAMMFDRLLTEKQFADLMRGIRQVEAVVGALKIGDLKEGLALSPQMVPTEIVPPHTSRLAALLERARAVTAARGAQAALAKSLGARRQHVHRWLSGLAEPGGETTLRLLEWVRVAEATKSKDADRVAARPARKAPTKPTHERKQSKGRRRR